MENAESTARMIRARGAIFILELLVVLNVRPSASMISDCSLAVRNNFLFRQQVFGRDPRIVNQVEEANHHLVPALLPPDHSLCGVWILRIVWRVIEMRCAFNSRPRGQHNWFVEVVPKLPVPVVLRHAQNRPRLP